MVAGLVTLWVTLREQPDPEGLTWWRSPRWSRGGVSGPPPGEEVVAEAMGDPVYGDHNPIPLHCWGETGVEIGCEVEPRKKGGVGRRFKIWIYFLLLYSDLICNKSNFPQSSLFCL